MNNESMNLPEKDFELTDDNFIKPIRASLAEKETESLLAIERIPKVMALADEDRALLLYTLKTRVAKNREEFLAEMQQILVASRGLIPENEIIKIYEQKGEEFAKKLELLINSTCSEFI